MKTFNIIIILFTLVITGIYAGKPDKILSYEDNSLYSKAEKRWVDSVFNSLSIEEKIAQLIMISSKSSASKADIDSVVSLIKKFNVGGVIFFKGSPVAQSILANYYQSIAKTQLFIAIDGEWGISMRLDSTPYFPKQMTLGAIENEHLLYLMGKAMAKQCQRLGIHINFAPVVDINNNPNNPVINFRSFGENKNKVAGKGIAIMNGMQDKGIMAVAKHFPGHGNTEDDSHLKLSLINQCIEELYDNELFSFREIIKKGIEGVMVAHLFVPALDSTKNTATSLSKKVITNLLKNEMSFKGLVFTDALDMKGVTSNFKSEEIGLKAFLAGNDILLMPLEVEKTIKAIKTAMDSGIVNIDELNERCRKILHYKYKYHLNKPQIIKTDNIIKDLNHSDYTELIRTLYENAITLVKNNKDLLPLKNLDTLKIASLVFGDTTQNEFQNTLSLYSKVEHYNFTQYNDSVKTNELLQKLQEYNLIIIAICNTRVLSTNAYGININTFPIINKIKKNKKVVLNIFANPYTLSYIGDTSNVESIIISYEDKKLMQDIAAQAIFGGIAFKGKLPMSNSHTFPTGLGIVTKPNRLKYTIPNELNINQDILAKVDSIANNGILLHAYPGCEILALQNGKVFYNKSFGSFKYDTISYVKNNTIYDLASLTKIFATALAIMRLQSENKININLKLSEYLPFLKNTNKENITIKEIMSHQAGLLPWIPFYISTMQDGKLNNKIYSRVKTQKYSLQVADSIFITKEYKDTMLLAIAKSPLREKKYLYSDLGFIMLRYAIENITHTSFENYLYSEFYKSLGEKICFNPLGNYSPLQIAPTENDKYFRMQCLQGYVNDQCAAMLGGVSGHAGLFSNASGAAALMYILLNNGNYGGKSYIDKNIIKLFTSQIFQNNRRGLGFDRTIKSESSPTCSSASLKSFGHSGFTGTYVWADPANGLVYVFLSNRTYPEPKENKLAKMNIRTDIQQLFYNALLKQNEVKSKIFD